MRRFLFYLDIFISYIGNALKLRIAYRGDFLIGFFADVMTQMIGIIFVITIFSKVPDIRGWSFYEVLFIWGFAQVTIGIFSTFFLNLFHVSEEYVIEGRFDRILLRPLNTFFQVITERVYLEESSNIFIGIILLSIASRELRLIWSKVDFLIILVLVVGGTLIYVGLYTALVSLTFWFKDRGSVISPFVSMETFSNYPITIYSRQIRIILSWLIPYAFTAFYPSTYFLKKGEFNFYVILTPLVGIVFFIIGYLLWQMGTRVYESTGT